MVRKETSELVTRLATSRAHELKVNAYQWSTNRGESKDSSYDANVHWSPAQGNDMGECDEGTGIYPGRASSGHSAAHDKGN